MLPVVGSFSPASIGTSWCDQTPAPGGDAHELPPDRYTVADAPAQWNAQYGQTDPFGSDQHEHVMSDRGQSNVRVDGGYGASHGAPLMSERALGQDTRHATWSAAYTTRPWEADYGADIDGGISGQHTVQVPGAAESRGVLPGNIFRPARLTTRTPPMPWDEPTREPAPSITTTGMV